MTDCKSCSGTGIMILYMGEEGWQGTKAPCIFCSSKRTLEDIEREHIQAAEQKEIQAHNERIQGL